MTRRRLAALEGRPWALALIAAAGTTLLLPSAAALLLPTDLLDAAISLGEWRLDLGIAGLFAVSASVARLCLRRRSFAEQEVDDPVAARPIAGVNGRPVSRVEQEAATAVAARSYLR
jgi:hypothetical protein